MIWEAASNQTVFDLAIQLYGDVSFAAKIVKDNNLLFTSMTSTKQRIYYDLQTVDATIQKTLTNNNKILATGFLASVPPIPPIIQRSYNNDFSLDFD